MPAAGDSRWIVQLSDLAGPRPSWGTGETAAAAREAPGEGQVTCGTYTPVAISTAWTRSPRAGRNLQMLSEPPGEPEACAEVPGRHWTTSDRLGGARRPQKVLLTVLHRAIRPIPLL